MILVEIFDSEEDNANFIGFMTFQDSIKFDSFFSNCSFDNEMYFQVVDYETMMETIQ